MLKSYTSATTLLDCALSLMVAGAALWLCLVEQSRVISSSRVILAYLTCSLIRDLLDLVTGCSSIVTCIFIRSRILVVGIWLILHLSVNGFFSHNHQRSVSTPEEAAGFFGQVIFRWMHPVLREGYSTRLNLASLPEIDQLLLSKALRKRALTYWGRECELYNPSLDAAQC
jgi:hypothetical protein